MKYLKYLVTISLLMICATKISGQTAEFYQNRIDHFKTQRVIGTVLIFSSVPMDILGVYYFVQSEKDYNSDDPWGGFFQGSEEFFLGCLFVVVGIGMLAGGIVMTTIGNKKIRQYQEKLNGMHVSLYCTPKHAGLTLTYRF
jgi:hypothetical protein